MNMWIHSFNRGDEAAFKFVFERYYRPLCCYVYKYTNDAADADDIVQDLFMSLWNRRENFDSEEKIEAFLFVSARNASLNKMVHKQFCQAKLEEYMNEQQYDEMEDILLLDEFDRQLNRWLETLPTECRKVMELALTGKKSQEIADMLHLAVSTVKNQKVKGLKKLRELCQQEYIIFVIELLLLRF